MLSVDPVIFADASNPTNHDLNTLKLLSKRLFTRDEFSEDDVEDLVVACMEQFACFRNKSGHYNQSSIWKSQYVRDGASHLWHEAHTYPECKELGYVACRITSKLLGIGSAE